MLLLLQDGGGFARIASWPTADVDVEALAPVLKASAQSKITEKGESPVSGGVAAALIGYPVTILDAVYALVGLCFVQSDGGAGIEHKLQVVATHAVSLREFLQRGVIAGMQARMDQTLLASKLVAGIVEADSFQYAAMGLANEVSDHFACDRVCVGVCVDEEVEIRATSHTGNPDLTGNLVGQIADAMTEVVRAGKEIVVPASGDEEMLSGDHKALADLAKDIAICSVPLTTGAVFFGVLTLERTRGQPFTEQEVAVCTVLGKLLGPVLEQKLDADRGIFRHGADELMLWGRALVGPRHTGLKLFSTLALLAVLAMTFIHSDYRVAAKTVVEGAVQRAAVAPFEGYVAESFVRAGDTVAKGQVIVRLDERDLLVERAKWDAEREQHLRKYRQAQANYDRASMSVIGAQVNQAEAQLNLVDEKLTRARIVAPFDGVVLTGDLSQLLGTPVEQGKVLFEIAPLDAYRVILKVDERDITYVEIGQRGELRLSGLPSAHLPFTVKQITSVSTAEEGRNYFRVEAHVDSAGQRLRPGMEGVGKIVTPERSLIWIWTHNLTDWLRLTLWSWLP